MFAVWKCTLLCLSVGLTLGGCGSDKPDIAQRDKASDGRPPDEAWQEFVSEDPAYLIRYPDGWRVSQQDRMLTIEPPTRDAAITVNVPTTDKSLEEAADLAIQAVFQDADPITPQEPVVIEGIHGVAQEFERKGDDGSKRWLTLFLLNNGRFAAITANGPADVIARDRILYNRIMRTFRFVDRP